MYVVLVNTTLFLYIYNDKISHDTTFTGYLAQVKKLKKALGEVDNSDDMHFYNFGVRTYVDW